MVQDGKQAGPGAHSVGGQAWTAEACCASTFKRLAEASRPAQPRAGPI